MAAAAAIALLIAGGIVAAVLGGRHAPPAPPAPAPPPLVTVPPSPLTAGITEANPHLVAPGPQPAAFAPWRDRLQALHPRYLRILVDWRRVQPAPSRGTDWSQPADGCLRGLPPCAPFAGIRDELRAARAAHMVPVVVILNTPDWAAAPPAGCEARGAGARARMPADLGAYRVLVRSLLELGAAEGIDLPWWSAWNEPNHGEFLGPQHSACDAGSPARSPQLYAQLVRALKAELDAAPGEQRIVLGETAALSGDRRNGVGAAAFARALPEDVVCDGAVWGQHAYAEVNDRLAGDAAATPGASGLLSDVGAALDAHRCPGGPMPIWITETGASPGDGAAGCRALATALASWYDDPRVQAAFQYTFRQDTAFPVGLADARLTALEPAYAAWRAYADGGRGALADPAAACATR